MNREDIIRIWRNASPSTVLTEEGLRICEAIAAAEREACAKVCEDVRADSVSGGGPVEAFNYSAKVCSAAIRARSNT